MPTEEKPYRVYRGGRARARCRSSARQRGTPGPERTRSRREPSIAGRAGAGAGSGRHRRRPARRCSCCAVLWAIDGLSRRSAAASTRRTHASTRTPPRVARESERHCCSRTRRRCSLLGTRPRRTPTSASRGNHSDSIMILRTDPSRTTGSSYSVDPARPARRRFPAHGERQDQLGVPAGRRRARDPDDPRASRGPRSTT